jgi:hypothetical protein
MTPLSAKTVNRAYVLDPIYIWYPLRNSLHDPIALALLRGSRTEAPRYSEISPFRADYIYLSASIAIILPLHRYLYN